MPVFRSLRRLAKSSPKLLATQPRPATRSGLRRVRITGVAAAPEPSERNHSQRVTGYGEQQSRATVTAIARSPSTSSVSSTANQVVSNTMYAPT